MKDQTSMQPSKVIVIVLSLLVCFSAAAQERIVRAFNTMPQLLSVNPNDIDTLVAVEGIAASGDGSGGLFRYYSNSAEATNATTIFTPNNGVGRWIFIPIQTGGSGITNQVFDAGQFRVTGTTNQSVYLQGGITNATGGSINFDLANDAPINLEITNNVNQTITFINPPTLTLREKSWLIHATSSGANTLSLAGLALTTTSGLFLNPPPAGINEYLLRGYNGKWFLDILRPAISATQRIVARTSAGGGDPEEATTSAVMDWIGNSRGGVPMRGSVHWTNITGTAGQVLTSGGPGADSSFTTLVIANTPLAYDGSTITVSNTAAATAIWTNSIPANTLGTNKSVVVELTGDFLNNSGGTSNFVFGVYLGTTLVYSDLFNPATQTTYRGANIRLRIAARNSASSQICMLSVNTSAEGSPSPGPGTGRLNSNGLNRLPVYGFATENSTAALPISITIAPQHAVGTMVWNNYWGVMFPQ